MRRKNRQFKVTVDVPECCKTDEDFAYMLQDTMESNGWTVSVKDEEGTAYKCPVGKVNFADYELEPGDNAEEEATDGDTA